MVAALSFSARATASSLPFMRDLALVAGPFNFATFLSVFVPDYTLITRQHGAGYVAKLRALPTFVDGWVAGLRDGAAVGKGGDREGVAAAVAAFDALIATDLADDPLASQSPPIEASEAERDVWRADVHDGDPRRRPTPIVELRNVLRDELLPVPRSDERAGICHLPDGGDGYRDLLWASTSTELTPEAVHGSGLEQLALLDEEYRVIGPPTLGIGDPVELRERLRTDASLRYATSDEIIADAMATLARADAEAPRWFTRLPRAVVRPSPKMPARSRTTPDRPQTADGAARSS